MTLGPVLYGLGKKLMRSHSEERNARRGRYEIARKQTKNKALEWLVRRGSGGSKCPLKCV